MGGRAVKPPRPSPRRRVELATGERSAARRVRWDAAATSSRIAPQGSVNYLVASGNIMNPNASTSTWVQRTMPSHFRKPRMATPKTDRLRFPGSRQRPCGHGPRDPARPPGRRHSRRPHRVGPRCGHRGHDALRRRHTHPLLVPSGTMPIATADAAPVLVATGVGVRLGGVTILGAVDLSVAPGDLVLLVGPNGAGKSTLLRALVGLLPSSGDVRIAGSLPATDAARAAFAYAPDEPALYEDLTLAGPPASPPPSTNAPRRRRPPSPGSTPSTWVTSSQRSPEATPAACARSSGSPSPSASACR
jgi:ABC-type multidrug transport system fused ATPase/permease subunit